MNSYTKLLFFSVLMVSFVACGENTTSVSDNNGTSSNDSSEVSSKTELLNFQDVYFHNMNVSYDGNNHILDEVVGTPDGTKITYTNRINYKDVGSYQATALLEKENYNSKLLSATLNIIPISFSNLKFEDKSIKYDGLDHINDIRLEGFLPEGTTTDLEINDENDNKVSEAINVGKYYYTITINNKNYNSLSLSATLTIKQEVKDMPVYVSNNEVYFSNGLDNEYIYSITDEDGIKKNDSSIPKEFKDCDSSVVYVAKSLFLNSAKEFKDGDTSILYSDGNIDDFVKYSDEMYFYSCNSLFDSEKKGIYKVDVSNDEEEPIVTKIYSGKTDSLSINKSSLFFLNKEDNYLYKIDINTNEKTLITETKINEYVVSDTKLYCCVNGILNDYIGVININSNSYEISKLTDYSGEFLKIRNNYLYFNNIDLYSLINLEYKGICRINLSTKVVNKVLYTEDVNGFDVDNSGNIYL